MLEFYFQRSTSQLEVYDCGEQMFMDGGETYDHHTANL